MGALEIDTILRLPHARGGVSLRKLCVERLPVSSPRPWGCFSPRTIRLPYLSVFPTPVGVFLHSQHHDKPERSLPHARGGVSGSTVSCGCHAKSSPRPWGCFRHILLCAARQIVFPTPVGVFPTLPNLSPNFASLPHARGGVSLLAQLRDGRLGSSPRPWGCFHKRGGDPGGLRVFPTPVGVFPSGRHLPPRARCLPHARGGVSSSASRVSIISMSSPRPWGCFCLSNIRYCSMMVFPTPVGVFL